MADVPIPVTGIDITSSWGAYQIGIAICCLLCGVTTTQVYLYFWNYYEYDKWTLKGLVLFLWTLDIVNIALIIAGAWKVYVSEWGRLSNVASTHAPGMDHTEIEAFVIVVVQCYLIRRIWKLNKNKTIFDWIILCTLPILSAWQLIGDIVYQIIGLGKPLAVLSSPVEVGLNISLRGTAAAVDTAVTLYMVRLLWTQRGRGLRTTRQMLSRMLLVVINTGMFTATLAIITLILLASRPDTLYYLITEFSLCTTYLSCFLANLNSRNFVKGPEGVVSLVDMTLQSGQPSGDPLGSNTYRMESTPSAGSWSRSDGHIDEGLRRKVNINIHMDHHVTADSGMTYPPGVDSMDSVVKRELSV